MYMNKLLEISRNILGWLIIVASALFIVSAIVYYPITLWKVTGCMFWLLGYFAYVVAVWLLYKVFIEE